MLFRFSIPTMKRLFAPAPAWVLALALALLGTAAHAAPPDPAHYTLTPQTLQKLKSAEADMEKLVHEGDDEDLSSLSVEQAARKIDSNPARKAALAKHGLTGMDLALSAHAMLHAGTYLMFEKEMDKAKAAELYRSYTAEQKANIELVRKTAQMGR